MARLSNDISHKTTIKRDASRSIATFSMLSIRWMEYEPAACDRRANVSLHCIQITPGDPSEAGRKSIGATEAGKRESQKQQQHTAREQNKSVRIWRENERDHRLVLVLLQFDAKSTRSKSRTPTRFDRKTPTTSVADESEFTPEKYVSADTIAH